MGNQEPSPKELEAAALESRVFVFPKLTPECSQRHSLYRVGQIGHYAILTSWGIQESLQFEPVMAIHTPLLQQAVEIVTQRIPKGCIWTSIGAVLMDVVMPKLNGLMPPRGSEIHSSTRGSQERPPHAQLTICAEG